LIALGFNLDETRETIIDEKESEGIFLFPPRFSLFAFIEKVWNAFSEVFLV
jgi:hypothetical protein